MRYSITFLEADLERLLAGIAESSDEAAAYLVARVVSTPSEIRLLVRDVILIDDKDIDSRSPVHISIPSKSYVPAIKRAGLADAAFVFVHSHPSGPAEFSAQDDNEEPGLFQLAHDRNPQPCHASLIWDGSNKQLLGRVWLPDGTSQAIDIIRSIGERWQFWGAQINPQNIAMFDRQVLAFGNEIQRQLQGLHIGIVGVGGTGSAIAEQLIRLGIGRLTVIDHDAFDSSNVNRVYGSGSSDKGTPKVDLVQRQAQRINIGTTVQSISRHLGNRDVAEGLRECDLVFSCTDDEWGRSILSRLAIYYLIPVIDMGVAIDTDPRTQSIRSVQGRVTVLQPGYPCLFCRERISSQGVAAEVLRFTDPARAADLEKEGYLVGAQATAPSVISFTTAVAAYATIELLDRLVGFKHQERKKAEYLFRFDADTITTQSRAIQPGCFCGVTDLWAAGDRKLFLGLTWPKI